VQILNEAARFATGYTWILQAPDLLQLNGKFGWGQSP
jgi:hypothetical protein